MEKQITQDELARYLIGESTPEEVKRVSLKISQTPELRHLLMDLPESRKTGGEKQQDLDRVLSDVGNASTAIGARHDRKRATDRAAIPRPTSPVRRAFVRGALVLSLLAILFVSILLIRQPIETDPQRYATETGERSSVELPDGTFVELNVVTSLEVASDYGEAIRRVRLNGEAFFDVVANAEKPFIVETTDAEIRVLGTSFNVRTYGSSEPLSVVVSEGTVKLQSDSVGTDASAILEAGMMGKLVTDPVGRATVAVESVDVPSLFAWREGRLLFEGESLENVAAELERWYSATIVLQGEELGSRRLDASFAGESLEDVLRTIGLALELEVSSNGSTYRLSAIPQTVSPISESPTKTEI